MKLLTALTFSICLGLAASAEELRSFDFSVYGQYPVRGVGYLPISEAAIEAGVEAEPPVSIQTHHLSRMGPYTYTGGNRITFFNLEDEQPVARVRVPTNSDRWLFVFVRNPRYRQDPENQLMYLVYPFNDSLANLPKDGLVFLNISGKELDGLVEDKRMQIGPGETDNIPVQESLPLNLWARDFSGERLLPALIKTYRFDRDHRYLIIFFPPVLKGSPDLDVRFLAESVEEE